MGERGYAQIEQYYHACVRVRNTGTYVPLYLIENIRVPMPGLWRSIYRNDQGDVCSGHVLFDDPCIASRNPNGVCSIIWDKVEEYLVSEQAETCP